MAVNGLLKEVTIFVLLLFTSSGRFMSLDENIKLGARQYILFVQTSLKFHN